MKNGIWTFLWVLFVHPIFAQRPDSIAPGNYPSWFCEVVDLPRPESQPQPFTRGDRYTPAFTGTLKYEIRLQNFFPQTVHFQVDSNKAVVWLEEQGAFSGNLILADFVTGVVFESRFINGTAERFFRLFYESPERYSIRNHARSIAASETPSGNTRKIGAYLCNEYKVQSPPDALEVWKSSSLSNNPILDYSQWIPMFKGTWLPLTLLAYGGEGGVVQSGLGKNAVVLLSRKTATPRSFPQFKLPVSKPRQRK